MRYKQHCGDQSSIKGHVNWGGGGWDGVEEGFVLRGRGNN